MFEIGIPTYNRLDLLMPSLEKYLNDFPNTKIHIFDNGNQHINIENDNVVIYTSPFNLGVATSWNLLCKFIFKNCDNALILNDDVYLGYSEDVVLKAIENSKVGFVQSAHNFSVFLINKNLYHHIGEFDEEFYPAYYEDSDYLYRMKLIGIRQDVDYSLNPTIALTSQTYEKDKLSQYFVNKSMIINKQRYIEKWGGLPLLETYKNPYNK
jgi:GT2 family glycosyltransferase